MPITAFKLLRRRKDNSLGPLFIDKGLIIEPYVTYKAESHPTKGFAHRPGFHVTAKPEAPHLRMGKDRVWCKVEIPDDSTPLQRPEPQGGLWYLAPSMIILEVMEGYVHPNRWKASAR